MRIPLSLLPEVLVIAFVVVFVTTRSSFAQDCRVTTTVRLLVEQGHPGVNVKPDQLKAKIGGAPAKVVAFSPGVKPVMILLIDISGSMKGMRPQTMTAAKQLSGSAGDRVAAVAFREQIVARAGGRAETQELLDHLATLKTRDDGTALYDTLIDTARRVDRDTALVVISDGADNASRESADQTVKLFLRSSWPPVFGLVVDFDHQQARRGHFLKKIVEATGGLAVYPASDSASTLAEAANALAAEVYAPFTVTLERSQPLSKPAYLELEIIGPDNKPRHDVQIAHVAEVTGCDSVPTSPAKAD